MGASPWASPAQARFLLGSPQCMLAQGARCVPDDRSIQCVPEYNSAVHGHLCRVLWNSVQCWLCARKFGAILYSGTHCNSVQCWLWGSSRPSFYFSAPLMCAMLCARKFSGARKSHARRLHFAHVPCAMCKWAGVGRPTMTRPPLGEHVVRCAVGTVFCFVGVHVPWLSSGKRAKLSGALLRL